MYWMKEAECTKALMSAHNLDIEVPPVTDAQHKSCTIQ